MEKDTIRDIKIFENLFFLLMEINFVKDIFFKKLKSFANTTDIEDLKKMGIPNCLLCKKKWDSFNVIPNNSHNFSKSLILEPLSKKKKVVIINKTRPFTIIDNDKEIKKEELILEDFYEKIENATTFGGICKNCDNIYNLKFEEKRNLNFNNKRHLNLFIERSSLFKYYRETRITYIIKYLLNLKEKKCSKEDWNNYTNLRDKIKNTNIIKIRDEIFNFEKIVFLNKSNIYHKCIDNFTINNKLFTDFINILAEKPILINLVILNNKSILILSSKDKNLLKINIDNIIEKIENNEFKDILLTKENYLLGFYIKKVILNDDKLYLYSDNYKYYMLIEESEFKKYGLKKSDKIIEYDPIKNVIILPDKEINIENMIKNNINKDIYKNNIDYEFLKFKR